MIIFRKKNIFLLALILFSYTQNSYADSYSEDLLSKIKYYNEQLEVENNSELREKYFNELQDLKYKLAIYEYNTYREKQTLEDYNNKKKDFNKSQELNKGVSYSNLDDIQLDNTTPNKNNSDKNKNLKTYSINNKILESSKDLVVGNKKTLDKNSELFNKKFEKAFALLSESKSDKALKEFKSILIRFPTENLAKVYYWLAETYIDLEDYSNAVKYLILLYKSYPKYEKTPIGLLKIANILEEVTKMDKACKVYNLLLQEYNDFYAQQEQYINKKIELLKCNQKVE